MGWLVYPEQVEDGGGDVGEDTPRRAATSGVATINGTGLSVWAVLGEPSGSSMCSALPWSAVTRHTPPPRATASTTSPQALVDGLDRVHRGRDHAGVADHVGVGEVDDREAKARLPVLAPGADEGGGGLAGAHLGREVVGGDVARRGRQLAPLPLVGGLLAAVEEVGDVRVLLGLGDVQLAQPGLGDRSRRA